MNLTITLPFPDKHLLPNAARRLHWASRAGYAQTARMTGKVETLNAIHGRDVKFEPQERIPLSLTFYPPTRRALDLDNCLSACKAYLDGVSEALEVNDKMYAPVILDWGKVVKGGQVVVTIG